MAKLGVNIDHVATLRQARRELDPDPIEAAKICLKAGADSIVAHLREDRRHINDSDIQKLRKIVSAKFNMEMSTHPEIVDIALRIRPDQATLVPEKRQEITTEGGLNVVSGFTKIKSVILRLQRRGVVVSLFVDPKKLQIRKAFEIGAPMIELHTGPYARANTEASIRRELNRLNEATQYARRLGLVVAAGHGLNYKNAKAVADIPGIVELNIGHSIISSAVFVGLARAVKDMVRLIR